MSPSGEDRVLLVSMPCAPLMRPSIALGLLAAHCSRLSVDCDVRYLTFPFAELAGLDEYLWLTADVPYEAFAGDWLFTEALYGMRPDADEAYIEEILRKTWHLRRDAVARIRALRSAVAPFLHRCLDEIDWAGYTLVGFTSMFQQNIASLALAARVKAAHPGVTIAFGGPNCEQPMGEALRRRFPFLDLVFSGKADVTFPETLEARRNGHGGKGAGRSAVPELDELPMPDFDAYFEQLRDVRGLESRKPELLVETSRGCWWGERSHCTFCGLNGATMTYHSKSPERVVREIEYLRDRHGVRDILVVDDILDMRYFRTVLPMLERADLDVEIFWEVKANLSPAHVRQLRSAGVRLIQPGIESLSDPVLKAMRKGTTALKNIELLKWCREYDVTPMWNLLYGFPGETHDDYRGTTDLIDAIWHLEPPVACGRLRLDRFSPYHADPGAFGLGNIRPKAPLLHLYPFGRDEVAEIAYYFDFDYPEARVANTYALPALERARMWMADGERGSLTLATGEDGAVHLVDSRRAQPAEHIDFEGWRADLFLACDRAQSLRELMRLPAVALVEESDVREFLADCVRRRLMVRSERSWLNVAVHVPARELSLGAAG